MDHLPRVGGGAAAAGDSSVEAGEVVVIGGRSGDVVGRGRSQWSVRTRVGFPVREVACVTRAESVGAASVACWRDGNSA